MTKAIQELSDEELLQRCSKDDLRAYNVLFDRYVGKLHRMGSRYVKDETVVEELAMDILLNLWDRRQSLQVKSKLSAYLFQAMHNKAISFLRKPVPVMLDIENFHEDAFVAGNTTDQGIILRDAEDTLLERLGQLSDQRRKVFQLSREQDMSYADIATEMNLSPNTVRNHMNAALDFLRDKYKSAAATTFLAWFIFICC